MTARKSSRNRKTGSYHHGALRQALLRAVETILKNRGVHELSLRAAARQAKVSHSAPAHHFRNKAGLLTAFAVEGFDRLSSKVGDSLLRDHPSSGAEIVESLAESYVAFALANPHHFAIMYRIDLLNLKDPEYQRANDKTFNILKQAVAFCVKEGVVELQHAEEATVTFLSLAHGLVTLWFSGRLQEKMESMRKPDFAQRSIRYFVRQLLVPAATQKVPAKSPLQN